MRIRDPEGKNRIRDKHPGSATLILINQFVDHVFASGIIFSDPDPKPNPKLKWSNVSSKTKLFSKKGLASMESLGTAQLGVLKNCNFFIWPRYF
jgi:hypothetical protein